MTPRPAHPQTRRRNDAWFRPLSTETDSAAMTRTVGVALLALAAGVVMLPLMATKGRAEGNTPRYTVLYSFTGGTDGRYPTAGLIEDDAGDLYGTTSSGGYTGSSCPYFLGCGVVFKLDSAGHETVLYTFTGGADGGSPAAGLIRDAGNLYGTTATGGNTSISCILNSGCGVVFKVDPVGNERVLYTFTGGADGAFPEAGLIRDTVGNLYGTAYSGGAHGWGVVFKLDPTGKETVLYNFTGGADGGGPNAGLIRDAAGNLYSTTLGGGNTSKSCFAGYGCGVVFKLDLAGNETVLYTFTGGADGGSPWAGLVRDAAGNLYGTTITGGTKGNSCLYGDGCGVVFKLDSAGNQTVLHSFSGGADGGNPLAGLTLDTSGRLGGTTEYGGTHGGGVAFELGEKGNETVLHEFCSRPNCVDGDSPVAGLLRDRAGNFYGTTSYNGAYVAGVVFKLSLH